MDGALAALRAVDAATLPAAPQGIRIGSPIGESRNFICIGTNYADTVKPGAEPPKEPIVFSKAPSCIVGPNDDVLIPKGSTRTDWEVEIAIVIGEFADRIAPEDANDHILGYCLCNDVSEREYQFDRGDTWSKGKGFPTFGPLGPWLVTPDSIDTAAIELGISVNGTPMQAGSTSTLLFPPAQIVAYLSQIMILQPGDVITTGTPRAVFSGDKVFLKIGDVMELHATGLGAQRQICRQA
jgi:2-keto-4-pentenoate hydratase/2-oxohepta-3-ene-1,7-dioic acid hydratase in catechol pathway